MATVDSLTADQQRELLAKLLKKKSANSRIMPASFAQRRLWFLDRLAPGKAYYNLPIALRLQGFLDVEILQRCFDDLVIRHEALRTTFSARMNEPVQVIRPPFEVAIDVEDLTHLQPAEREQESCRVAEIEAQTPFDLGVGPLFRVKLQRLSDDEYLLLLTIHHIVTDGWSNGILIRELSALHQTYTSNVPANLEALPIQYADFAVWQQQWLSGAELDNQIAYWKKRLVDLPDLQLPIDKPRPALQTFNGALAYRELPGDLSVKLRKLSKQSGASLFMTMLAGFGVLLQRYCGQHDIVVGSPIANRKRVELEGLMGFFVNSLVMRMDVSGDPGFAELLKRVQDTTLGAYEHQDLPFEKLIEELQPERIQSQNPLFQVMFALQNAPSAQLELTGLRLQAVAPFIRMARFDLEVHVSERSESLGLGFIYNTDLFNADTIERMLGHYQTLLEGMVADPNRHISELPMLGEQERRQVVIDWNQTKADYPRAQTVQALFEAQVSQSPDACAVEYAGDSLSYTQLNERANQLAHYLRQQGVGAEVKVGLYLERSLDMVVALLGILKAGGAYVPLDLDYPSSRIAFMLEDAEVPVLLTTAKLTSRLPERVCERVCLDTDWAQIARQSADNPEVTTTADSLAYVIYTSGSTGTPKGVEIRHRAINRLVRDTDYYQVDASDRIAQASSNSFDAATFEVWGALLNGAQLVGIDKNTLLNSRALAALLQEKGVTAMFITTAVFNQIAREAPTAFSELRAVMFGGEAVDCNAVRRVLKNSPPQRLLHVYGPTESTTFASWYPIESVAEDATTVPIGRPLANTTLYVLDANRSPVPVGVSGELYIGGDGLARGYLNRAELTADRFVPNPFEADSKLYRTGDKVRFRPDGAIEFQGRFDHQIKLRGFRIELGEIETALLNHEALQDAVAIVREDEPGDKRIAAYLVASPAWVEQISSGQSGEHVDEWQALYEETYANIDETQDLTTNFTGWNSSYTGEPIPLVEMEEWQASTVARIAALQPHRVMEIGCGTGLLLFRLAPECERYVGTDFSAVAQRQLREVVTTREEYQHVELWQRMADDFSDVEPGDFDTVIINSVTQYLPSMDYLADVVEGAIAAIADGGRILMGDIRSLPLLKAYHTSVQLHLSPDDAGGGELLRNVQQHVEEENELVIEPAFFHALKQRIPRLSHVEILLKQGQYHNELSGYRYDVVLHVEAQAEELPEHGQWLDWGASDLNEVQLKSRLEAADQDWLGISAMPNARVYRDVTALEQLQGEGSALSVGELKQAAESGQQRALEPDELWRLAETTGYQLELSYSGAGTDGRMDALFQRSRREDCAGQVFWPQQQEVPERAWSAYGTNPLKGRLGNELIPLLRQDLQQQLPDYMMPSVYVLLDALPLNPNGKVERKALPVPGDVRASLGAEYTAPRSAMEQQLAGIWAEVLKLERVGIHDNFFDLGGHSLMATQVVSRVRAQLHVELPLSEMFGYPTVAELAPVMATLLDGSDGEAAEVIPVADRNHPLPLSFAQERLWFLDQLQPDSAAYNMCLSLRLSGELNVVALTESLNTIVDRQQTLRTHFGMHQGKPIQIIDAAGIELRQDDLSALASDALEGEIKTRVNKAALQPFDLGTGPLLRSRLLRLSDHEHVLSLTMHHIISDGWSLGVLFRELGTCYAAFTEGKQPLLPELPIQYADFAVWQRDWLSGEVLDSQLTYWQQKLKDLTPLELPVDRPRPAVKTYNGASEALKLDSKLCKKLEQLSQQAGVTPFMTLLAGFAVLMQRYCGQDDIVIGSPIANRNRSELEQLIGFFINTLVLRLDVSGNPDFRTLLGQTQETTLGAYQHQDIPFEKLVEVLQPDRDRSRNPLFQVQFSLQNAPIEPLKLKGLELEPVRSGTQSTRFDLECHIWPGAEGLDAVFIYNTDLFDADTIKTLLTHYQTLLAGIVAGPDRRISELSMLGAREVQQFADWNRTSTDYPADKSVRELFDIQAARSPDAIAVDFHGESLSYARLNERANQLAHYLQARGVGPEVLVGLYLERGLAMIVGLLGILKAGGAYLPLDLDYPQPRIKFMLEDAGVPVLLSLSTLVDALPVFAGEIVCLDSDWPKIAAQRIDNPAPCVTPDNLAYVIYTSGSTGKPKGVEIPQRAIIRLVCNTDYYQVDSSDRIAQASNVSFDAATFEIWGALLNGAQLVGIDKEVLLNSNSLAEFLREQRISAMFLTTALFNQVAREMPAAFESLRSLMFGGEAVDPAAVRQVLANRAPQRLLHVYGPTESTTFASWYRVEAVSTDASTVPIGRPVANTTLQVLDGKMNPVPVGVPGELYIGGDGLARGYLNRAELTAEKFIADPRHPQNRLYRTGDRVRYRHSGAIEYLGRFDHQVKLRGFRVELGEIETALLKHQNLSDAIVIVHEDDPGNKRLLAYVVAQDADAPSATSLREFIAKSLPNYMLPSAFVILEKLPLTSNGKIDRKALPLPDDLGNILETEYVAPRNELERDLARIWAQVLKLERVGIHDNFFNLGGHSLLATRIVSHIREQMKVELPLSDMFDCPTVAELAAVDRFTADVGTTTKALDIDSQPLQVTADLSTQGATFPLSFAQERLWYIHAIYPHVGAAYNIPFLVHIDTCVSNLEALLEGLQQRHAILRTTYALDGTQPVQKVSQDQGIVVEMIDKSDFTEAAMKQEIVRHSTTPIDLATGPIWRSLIIKQGNRAKVLLITIHHIATDGRSIDLLKWEILRLCQQDAIATGSTESKPGLQYIDYALWHRKHLSASRLEVLGSYWAEKLDGIPDAIDLPIDKPRAPVYSHSGALEKVALSKTQSDELRQFSRKNEVTLFMLMLAIFKLLLSRYAQQSDIVVGTAISGRTLAELDDIIGLFVNSLVLRTDLSGSQSFTTLLANVRRTTLEAFEHQDLPFDKIVEIVRPERDLSRNPVFQVMFTYNILDGDTEKDAIRQSVLSSEEIVSDEAAGSHVDLSLIVTDDGSQLLIMFDYNDDLFEAATVRRMLTHYRRLLEVSIATPETSIDRLELLNDEEKQLMVGQWNQTQADFVENETVLSLFEQQVKRTPQAVAVSFEQDSLDYSELAQRTDNIACLLLSKNVEPGQFVGVFIERSIELVVAILGILKAGAAYVPLDPEYPEERINHVIADSNISVLLSQTKLEKQLPSDVTDVIYLDSDRLYESVKPQVLPRVTEDMLAYAIYTSGSTGIPKGVAVPHRALCNHMLWMQDAFPLNDTDKVLQKTPFNFDASVWEFFAPLIAGARLVIAQPGAHRDPRYLVKVIAEQQITRIQVVPSLLRLLLDEELFHNCDSLRQVFCGGEALSPELQKRFFACHRAELCNLYGPTEATIDSTFWQCDSDSEARAVPIGRPIANTRVYILDHHRQPVPIGVTGELHIGGAGLAQGYINRPQLTAEKFIADPFSNDSTARLYKTGDLTRYRADGNIEFIGRVDQQVKIRGFRIELDEIESALTSHAGVRESAVLVREDKPGDKRLVAYIAGDGADAPSVTDLREFLRAKLPDYMVPAAFVVLDSMPLSVNGKLDRHALPVPDGARQLDQALVEPRSDLEKKLADIWQQVLDVDQVGIHDNFFDLGGHSLKLVELHKKLSDKIDTPLTLVDLFAHPTVSALVEHITKPEVPGRPRSGDVGRVTNAAAVNKRLQQLRQSRKRNTGLRKTNG